MFPVQYISIENQRQLDKLRALQEKTKDVEQLSKIDERIQEIEKTRKPLMECSVEECIELKSIIYDKFQKMSGIGKTGLAMQFSNMILSIENRVNTLVLDEVTKAAEAKKEQEERKALERIIEKNEKGKNKSTAGKLSNPWSVRIDDGD